MSQPTATVLAAIIAAIGVGALIYFTHQREWKKLERERHYRTVSELRSAYSEFFAAFQSYASAINYWCDHELFIHNELAKLERERRSATPDEKAYVIRESERAHSMYVDAQETFNAAYASVELLEFNLIRRRAAKERRNRLVKVRTQFTNEKLAGRITKVTKWLDPAKHHIEMYFDSVWTELQHTMEGDNVKTLIPDYASLIVVQSNLPSDGDRLDYSEANPTPP